MPTQQAAGLRVPYELIPTTLDGAFISPAPPADFDPNTASRASLIKNGFLWRRPGKDDDPAVRAAWERAFSRPWRAEDRLVPEFAPQPSMSHHLRSVQRAADGISIADSVWAGVAVRGTWTGVIGQWVIPAVTEPLQPQGTTGGWNSLSWIGLDGAVDSNDVLQAGVQQLVDHNGNPQYVAWYEWFAPRQEDSPPYIFVTAIPNFAVSPGQTVYCSIQYVGSTAGQVYFANQSTGQHFSVTLAPPPGATFNGSSAEWIMESPNGGEPESSLPIFTPLVFTSAACCGPNGTAGNPSGGDTYNIVGFGTTLTSVTPGLDTLTIDYVGPLPAGPVFGLSPGGQAVWQYDGTGASWTQVGGPAGEIFGGGYGLVATNPSTGDLWRYLGIPQEWELIGTPGASFAVTGDTVFGLSTDRQAVWQYDGTGASWTQVGGPAGEIFGGGYGLVATNPSTGDLWRYLGIPQEWELIGTPGASFAVTGDTVFGLSTDRQAVWQYDGTGASWTQVGGPAGEIFGGGYGLVATNPSTGDLWRYLGIPQEWELIGTPGASFAVTGDTVFGLSTDRQAVWQYDGTGASWTQIGGPAAEIAAAPAG